MELEMAGEPSDRDYKVGYGKPPMHTRFKKGQSGNPKGARGRLPSLQKVLEKELKRKITVTEGGVTRRITVVEGLIKRLVAKGFAGDRNAIFKVLALAESFPPVEADQAQQLSTTDAQVLEWIRDEFSDKSI